MFQVTIIDHCPVLETVDPPEAGMSGSTTAVVANSGPNGIPANPVPLQPVERSLVNRLRQFLDSCEGVDRAESRGVVTGERSVDLSISVSVSVCFV